MGLGALPISWIRRPQNTQVLVKTGKSHHFTTSHPSIFQNNFAVGKVSGSSFYIWTPFDPNYHIWHKTEVFAGPEKFKIPINLP